MEERTNGKTEEQIGVREGKWMAGLGLFDPKSITVA
jgi:hypothetical protein